MTTGSPAASRWTPATAGLLVTLTALVTGEVILWRAGSMLPSLPLDRVGIHRVLTEAEPLAVVAAVLRLVGLAAGAVLLLTTGLGILARCCGAVRLAGRIDRWTPGGLRRLLDGALGAGLAASIGLTTVPAAADPGGDPAATATIRRLPDAPTTTLRRLPDAPAEPPPPPVAEPPAPEWAPPPRAPATALAPVPRRTTEVVVRPGDSFWVLAERHEARRLGRPPTEAEIGACWQELVALNRHHLAIPGNPDLIFPGQTFVIPCP